MSIFNELVIKNDPVKKATPFFVFMEGVQLTHYQVLVLEDRTFHRKVLSRPYRSSKFNYLANFYLHKNFRVGRSLVKDVQRFGKFSLRYFKF